MTTIVGSGRKAMLTAITTVDTGIATVGAVVGTVGLTVDALNSYATTFHAKMTMNADENRRLMIKRDRERNLINHAQQMIELRNTLASDKDLADFVSSLKDEEDQYQNTLKADADAAAKATTQN